MPSSAELIPGKHDTDPQAALLGDVQGGRVLGMGPDVWEVSRRLAPRLGASGHFVGVYGDAETIREARRRNGSTNGSPASKVEFHQVEDDLRLSRAAADAVVAKRAPASLDELLDLQRELARLRDEQPFVADRSVDLVFATGLRHLPTHAARVRMLQEFHRVVKRGGRLVVLDVVSDEDADPEALLKVGDVDGDAVGRSVARDEDLLNTLAEVGFYGVTLVRRDEVPWTIVKGVELRRVAVVAHKGKEGPCYEHYQAVMYRGPFSSVQDDDGHVYPRGRQIAVCKKTFDLLSREPYSGQFELNEPLITVPAGAAAPFPCHLTNPVRDPQDLKFRRPTPFTGRPADPQIHQAAASVARPTDGPAGVPRQADRRKSVAIVERRQTAGSAALARSLRDRHGDALDLQMVELAGDPKLTLPAQLRLRLTLSGDACLPALVVDGVLVAVGPLPEIEEVERVIAAGRPSGPLPISNLASLAAEAGACGPAGCC